MDYYDVVIVGAGPAGLFAAANIIANSQLSLCVFDKGKELDIRICSFAANKKCKCGLCDVVHGVGGASAILGGKFCYYPAGRDLDAIPHTNGHLRFSQLFESYNNESISPLLDEFAPPMNLHEKKPPGKLNGVFLKYYGSRIVFQHQMIQKFTIIRDFLRAHDINIRTNHNVQDVNISSDGKFMVTIQKYPDIIKRVKCSNFIIASGRTGINLLKIARTKLGIEVVPNAVDFGIRIEMPTDKIADSLAFTADPKFKINENTNNEIRTFCTCIGGNLIPIKIDGISIVDGYFATELSSNANIAIVNRTRISQNITNYAFNFAKSLNKDDKILIQRLRDFKRNRDSQNQASLLQTSSLPNVFPGNISKLMPPQIRNNLINGIDLLARAIPRIAEDDNLVYAPVIDRFWDRVRCNNAFMSSVKNLYITGDATGHARGIIQAIYTGLVASDNIINYSKKND